MPGPISSQQQEFRIGLLVISGFLAVVVLILFSDQISFDSYYRVTAYMDSAAGLRSGSPVELAGIQIGEVDTIQTSRSGTAPGAVIAVLRIDDRYTLYQGSTLTIGSSGIFGDSFLTFSNTTETGVEGSLDELSKDGNAVVVASPGFIDEFRKKGEKIISGLTDILNDKTRDDVKRLIRESADTAAEAKQLVKTINASSEHISNTLAQLDAASLAVKTHAEKLGEQSSIVLGDVEQGIAEMRQHVARIGNNLDGIAANLDNSLKSVDELSRATNEIIQASKGDIVAGLKNLAQLSGHFKLIAEDVRNGKGVIGKLLQSEALAKDIDKVAINIQNFSERIADHPEILVFGDSEEDQAKARQERQRREQRRAFNEGYGSVLGTRRPGGEQPVDVKAPEKQPLKNAEIQKPEAVEVIE